MLLRLSFLFFSIFCWTASFAHADDASKLAKIHEFFNVAKLNQMSDQVMKQAMDQVDSGMMQQMVGVTLSDDQQAKLKQFSEKVKKIVSDALSWDKLEPEYAKLYADAYTEEQIDDILTFYKSPTGQAMVEKSPGLIKQSTAIAQQRLTTAMPELQKLMKELMQQAPGTAQPK
jgi:hypothetical protein